MCLWLTVEELWFDLSRQSSITATSLSALEEFDIFLNIPEDITGLWFYPFVKQDDLCVPLLLLTVFISFSMCLLATTLTKLFD